MTLEDWTPEGLAALEARVMENHPKMLLDNGEEIYVCAGCEELHPVLFLAGDRWLCTNCRNKPKGH